MKYTIIKRLLQAVIVILGVTLAVFIMLRVIPGNPIASMMGEHADRATVERMTAEFGLDQPVWRQFIKYISDVLHGDFGTSYSLGKPVSQLMKSSFSNSLFLALGAAVFAWIMGLLCGALAAIRKNGVLDHLFMGFSLLGVSMPVFMGAMLFQYVFAFHFHWLPISGTDSILSFLLPSITLGWNSAGSIARLVRSSLLDVLEADFIDTARAKGRRHHYRNRILYQRDRTACRSGYHRKRYPPSSGNRTVLDPHRDLRQSRRRLSLQCAGSQDPKGGLNHVPS